jgi:hypothetical protein
LTAEKQFYDKLSEEYDAFIDRLRGKSTDEIINAAYEKASKDEIVSAFENNYFTENDYAAFNAQDNLLDALYSAWLDTNTADFEQMCNVIDSYIKRESGYKVEHFIDDPEWHDLADREEPDEGGDYSLEERIAADISAKSEPTAQAINGAVNYGDWVIVRPDEHYGCLVGQVTGIDKLDSEEHDTGNETDDVHVNFVALEYSESAKADLLEALDGIYPDARSFDDIPLDDVIMAPESLISLTGLDFERVDKLAASYKAAREFGNKVLAENFGGMEQELIDRVEQNYTDYNNSLLSFGKQELIEMAAAIHAHSDAWSYMTAYHTYSDEELQFYSQFQNPLEIVADAWRERNIDVGELEFSMDFIAGRKAEMLTQYPLMRDIPTPEEQPEQVRKPPEQAKPTPSAPKKKKSLTAQLHEAVNEAKEYNAGFTHNPKNHNKERD